MSSIIDISVPLHNDMPLWPGGPGYDWSWHHRIDPDHAANVSQMSLGAHTGTHVDAPLHFVPGGNTVEQMALDVLVGPAVVAALPDAARITAADLAALNLPDNTRRVLFKTRNSALWGQPDHPFQEDFVALTTDAAQWVVGRGIRLVGVDYLSVQLYHDGPETHQILLGADVVIVEGLDLSAVSPGAYELTCLPLKLLGAEGAPARAILRPLA